MYLFVYCELLNHFVYIVNRDVIICFTKQGVLHALNGCGYPKQNEAQSRVVRCIVDHLLSLESTVSSSSSSSGLSDDNRVVVPQFFHTNDIRVRTK